MNKRKPTLAEARQMQMVARTEFFRVMTNLLEVDPDFATVLMSVVLMLVVERLRSGAISRKRRPPKGRR